jgi:hypothetical protein
MDPPQVSRNPYLSITTDSYHTLATSLGRTIEELQKAVLEPLATPEVRDYKNVCIRDAQRELALLNDAMKDKYR